MRCHLRALSLEYQKEKHGTKRSLSASLRFLSPLLVLMCWTSPSPCWIHCEGHMRRAGGSRAGHGEHMEVAHVAASEDTKRCEPAL